MMKRFLLVLLLSGCQFEDRAPGSFKETATEAATEAEVLEPAAELPTLPPAAMPIIDDTSAILIGGGSQGALRPARTGNKDEEECSSNNNNVDPACEFSGYNPQVQDVIAYILNSQS